MHFLDLPPRSVKQLALNSTRIPRDPRFIFRQRRAPMIFKPGTLWQQDANSPVRELRTVTHDNGSIHQDWHVVAV